MGPRQRMTHSAIKPKKDRRLGKKERLTADVHVLRYLRNHPDGLSSEQLQAWLRSRGEHYSLAEVDAALFTLRDRNVAACTNRVWWLRAQPGIES